MKSPNTSTHKRGFTLIEILVVLGIFALIATLGIGFSYDSYRGYLFRTEYNNVAYILTKARNQSANNFNDNAHGVYFDSSNNEYILFVGTTYPGDSDPQNQVFPMKETFVIEADGEDVFEVVFAQLSGNLLSCEGNGGGSIDPCEISFADTGSHDETISINEFGGITF